MKKTFLTACILLTLLSMASAQELKSPNGKFVMTFTIGDGGSPNYSLAYKGKVVIKPSKLGLELKYEEARTKQEASGDMQKKSVNPKASLFDNFTITDTKATTFDESWNPVWGEVKTIRNHYNEMAITLNQQQTQRVLILRFRLFDEGLGFRYEFPTQKNLVYFVIKEERTQFAMTGDHT